MTDDLNALKSPILILIRGLPGSGKSYLADSLRDTLGQDITVLLDPDAIDFESEAYKAHSASHTADGVDAKLHPYRFLRGQAYEGITDHKIIIWNQPFTNLEIFKTMVDKLVAHADEQDVELPVIVVEVNADPQLAKERVDKRKQEGGHGPSTNTFDRFVSEYSTAASAGYEVVAVRGQDEVSASVATILDHIGKLLNS